MSCADTPISRRRYLVLKTLTTLSTENAMLDTTYPTEESQIGSPPPPPTNLCGLTFAELSEWMRARGFPAFRARQVASWLYRSLVSDFASMRNLPASCRSQLDLEATIEVPQVRAEVTSRDGRTRKLLLELRDGRLIETVLMLYPSSAEGRSRATVCVSTQAGCAYGCTFCATGQMGFDRHLTPAEIVGQVVHFARALAREPWRAPDD